MQRLNETAEYTHDKSKWPKGEWTDEPDKIMWSTIFNNYEYKCIIQRGKFGTLCGYVIINENHKAFNCNRDSLDVHGSITWCGGSIYEDLPLLLQTKWFGFDCAHMMDFMPFDPIRDLFNANRTANGNFPFTTSGKTYKNIAFVTREIESLIKQLDVLNSA